MPLQASVSSTSYVALNFHLQETLGEVDLFKNFQREEKALIGIVEIHSLNKQWDLAREELNRCSCRGGGEGQNVCSESHNGCCQREVLLDRYLLEFQGVYSGVSDRRQTGALTLVLSLILTIVFLHCPTKFLSNLFPFQGHLRVVVARGIDQEMYDDSQKESQVCLHLEDLVATVPSAVYKEDQRIVRGHRVSRELPSCPDRGRIFFQKQDISKVV